MAQVKFDEMVAQKIAQHGLDARLAAVLNALADAITRIEADVRIGPLAGNIGLAGAQNVQGEDQKALDVIADIHVQKALEGVPGVAALISEELDDVIWLKEPQQGDFLVYYDPLDGSSNLDVNLSVGTIFSIIPVQADGDRNVLHPGRLQICAGYALYGPATTIVLTFGDDVQGFTMDPQTGAFLRSHDAFSVPTDAAEFAINISRYRHLPPGFRAYIDDCLAGKDGPRGRDLNMRWVASMVAEIHRILTRGGVFLYPVDAKTLDKGGRLRLMYEANPMSMIMAAAGGAGSTGWQDIVDVMPQGHHDRVSVVIGSANEVAEVVRYNASYPKNMGSA